jgi:hypothetical protein
MIIIVGFAAFGDADEEGAFLTPAMAKAAESGKLTGVTQVEEPILWKETNEESRFQWWLLMFLLLAFLLFLISKLSKRKKRPAYRVAPKLHPAQKAAKPKTVPTRIRILGKEEIRRYSYELYERRHGFNGDADGDWHQAVNELTAYYEDQGYRVIPYWEVSLRRQRFLGKGA